MFPTFQKKRSNLKHSTVKSHLRPLPLHLDPDISFTLSALHLCLHYKTEGAKANLKIYISVIFNGGMCTNPLFSNTQTYIWLLYTEHIYILCQLKAFQLDTTD